MVGPDALFPEPWALDGPPPVTEPCALLVTVRPQPCGVWLVLHLESASRFQSHRPHLHETIVGPGRTVSAFVARMGPHSCPRPARFLGNDRWSCKNRPDS